VKYTGNDSPNHRMWKLREWKKNYHDVEGKFTPKDGRGILESKNYVLEDCHDIYNLPGIELCPRVTVNESNVVGEVIVKKRGTVVSTSGKKFWDKFNDAPYFDLDLPSSKVNHPFDSFVELNQTIREILQNESYGSLARKQKGWRGDIARAVTAAIANDEAYKKAFYVRTKQQEWGDNLSRARAEVEDKARRHAISDFLQFPDEEWDREDRVYDLDYLAEWAASEANRLNTLGQKDFEKRMKKLYKQIYEKEIEKALWKVGSDEKEDKFIWKLVGE